MTKEQILLRIGEIKANTHDDEVAHLREDQLRADFIRFIVSGDNPDLAALASLVLSTDDLEFARWCA